jgi:DNA-binding protein YbaB
MATSKKTKIDGYFFMSICNSEIDVNCSGDKDVIAAAFATLLLDNRKDGEQLKQILATAIAIAAAELEPKKKPNPKQMNGVKSDEPFVKTRKKATK